MYILNNDRHIKNNNWISLIIVIIPSLSSIQMWSKWLHIGYAFGMEAMIANGGDGGNMPQCRKIISFHLNKMPSDQIFDQRNQRWTLNECINYLIIDRSDDGVCSVENGRDLEIVWFSISWSNIKITERWHCLSRTTRRTNQHATVDGQTDTQQNRRILDPRRIFFDSKRRAKKRS